MSMLQFTCEKVLCGEGNETVCWELPKSTQDCRTAGASVQTEALLSENALLKVRLAKLGNELTQHDLHRAALQEQLHQMQLEAASYKKAFFELRRKIQKRQSGQGSGSQSNTREKVSARRIQKLEQDHHRELCCEICHKRISQNYSLDVTRIRCALHAEL